MVCTFARAIGAALLLLVLPGPIRGYVPTVSDTMALAAESAKLTVVHVVFSAGPEHFIGLLSSMISIAVHISERRKCVIHLILSPSDLRLGRQLVGCFKEELNAKGIFRHPFVEIHRLRPLTFNLSKGGNPRIMTHHTFSRFFLHKYLLTASRAVWIDPDTLVNDDIRALYTRKMTHPIAAVPEHWCLWSNTTWRHYLRYMKIGTLKPVVKDWSAKVFNAGVMLLDLDAWRNAKSSISKSLVNLCQQMDGFDYDQLPLNIYFQNQYDSLEWNWNVGGLGWRENPLPPRCIKEGRIFHWNGEAKPWYTLHKLPHAVLFKPPQLQCSSSWRSSSSDKMLPQDYTNALHGSLKPAKSTESYDLCRCLPSWDCTAPRYPTIHFVWGFCAPIPKTRLQELQGWVGQVQLPEKLVPVFIQCRCEVCLRSVDELTENLPDRAFVGVHLTAETAVAGTELQQHFERLSVNVLQEALIQDLMTLALASKCPDSIIIDLEQRNIFGGVRRSQFTSPW